MLNARLLMMYEKDSPCSPKLMGEVGKTGIGKHFQGKVLIVLDFEVTVHTQLEVAR